MGGDKKKGSKGGDFNKHHRTALKQVEKPQNNRKPEEKAKDEIKLTRTNLWKTQKSFADLKCENPAKTIVPKSTKQNQKPKLNNPPTPKVQAPPKPTNQPIYLKPLLKPTKKDNHGSGTFKTSMCKNILEMGHCTHGEYCLYAHKSSELRKKSIEIDEENFKTRMCKNVLEKGHCIHGQYCQYAHKSSELRKKPSNFDEEKYKTSICKKILDTGHCIHGDNCNYAHSSAELRRKTSKNGEEEPPKDLVKLGVNLGDFVSKPKKGQIIPKTTKPPIPEPSKITILQKSIEDSKPLEIANPWNSDRSNRGPAFNTRAKINEMVEEKSRDILEENMEKEIYSSIISNFEEELDKNQGRCPVRPPGFGHPTCPSGFADFPPLRGYNTRAKSNEMQEKSRDILDENVEKGISSLTITNYDQEKNQDQGPTCPSGFSDFPPRAKTNEMDEKSRDIPEENVEKGIFSLAITDFDQEKNRDQGPPSPSGFSEFPPLSADNKRDQINEKEENSRDIKEVIKITDCGQDKDIIQGWGPTCPSEFSDVPPIPPNNTNTGVEINEMDEKSRDILEENFEKEISSSTITDHEQDQEKTQPRGPTCKLAKMIRDILEENLEKEISSLIITDCRKDQEKTQCQRSTCPPGFSDIPRAQKTNIEEEENVKLPKIFEDIRQNWGREYSTDFFCKAPKETPPSMVGHDWHWSKNCVLHPETPILSLEDSLLFKY